MRAREVVNSAHSPIRSYRYTVAMFPLPYKYVLRYRTRQNVGGISILASNTKCTRECRPHFAACGTPDRAMHAYQRQVGVLVPAQERRVQDVPMFIEQRVAMQLRGRRFLVSAVHIIVQQRFSYVLKVPHAENLGETTV
jgi:hypothetical protein